MQTKVCRICETEKYMDEFHKSNVNSDGRDSRCKTCRKSMAAQRYADGPDRERHLMKTYGITLVEYDELLESQAGGCAICGVSSDKIGRRLAVDHDHSTDEVRGLLCTQCNTMLGQSGDRPEILRLGAQYLERFS